VATLVEEFKAAFRGHPAGVALITAQTPEGPVGLTASSVASVSLEPLTLSFSVTKSYGSAGGVLAAQSFLVNLLNDTHAGLAEAFARSGAPRFTAEQGWRALPTGEPHLVDAPVALRAKPLGIIPAGDARLVLAQVVEVHRGPASAPLIYHDRTFFSLPAGPAA
jgi:flavin reductase (DIM6/NTAB) family NADH-FMN oxidoreductase RutF